MALVACPECSQRVSDQAATCPGCGFPLMRAEEEIISITYIGSHARRLDEYKKRLAEGWIVIEEWNGDSWRTDGDECQERFFRLRRLTRPNIA